MNINDIDIQWLGFRRNSSGGAIYGWFVMKGRRSHPVYRYDGNTTELIETPCYVFWGNLKKNINIEKKVLTREFIVDIKGKTKNFKSMQCSTLYLKSLGRSVLVEFEKFFILETLKGKND